MMNVLVNNILLECDTPGNYELHMNHSLSAEARIPCRSVAVMVFEDEYLVKVRGDFPYIKDGKLVTFTLLQNDRTIMEALYVDLITKEDADTFRLVVRKNLVIVAAELEEKQNNTTVTQDVGTDDKNPMVSLGDIEAIHEKYFANQVSTSVMAERRKMRRSRLNQVGERTVDYIMGELDNLIGLNAVKMEVKKLIAMEKQRDFLESIGMKDRPNDMLFLGNPGTGKTTVARYLTEVLYRMGKLKENKCVEINGHDLTGGYVGQTASTVDRHLAQAKGGVLFIDEAYSLLDGSETFASDAITKLLGALTKPNRDFVCILAGYEEDMNNLMRFNTGFESRVATKLHFEDYTVTELGEIFCSLIKSYGYSIEKDALTEVMKYFASVASAPKFSNGRFARNLFEKMEEEHCRYYDGTDEMSDVFRVSDLTDEVKKQLIVGIM